MSAKQAIDDKLQGSVATYQRCGGLVNNQIKKGLLLNLRLKKNLKSVTIWQSYKQERDCLVHLAFGQHTAKRLSDKPFLIRGPIYKTSYEERKDFLRCSSLAKS